MSRNPLVYVRNFFLVLFLGYPPTIKTMEDPRTWPQWLLVRICERLTGENWLNVNFKTGYQLEPSIQQVDNLRVSRVAHYKDTQSAWGHEFVLVTMLDISSPDEPLYFRYERCCKPPQAEDSKLPRGILASSRASSIFSNKPEEKGDYITPLTSAAFKIQLKNKKQNVLLRHMTFVDCPTILDLAAVLEAHSVLSPEYRLYATMCYWYAGSTYEVLENLYRGQSNNAPASKRSGKYGLVTGYRAVREKQDAHEIATLVESVKPQLRDENIQEVVVREEELEKVAREELERIPTFKALLQHSKARRDEVRAVISKRDFDRITGNDRLAEKELKANARAMEEKRQREAAQAEFEKQSANKELKAEARAMEEKRQREAAQAEFEKQSANKELKAEARAMEEKRQREAAQAEFEKQSANKELKAEARAMEEKRQREAAQAETEKVRRAAQAELEKVRRAAQAESEKARRAAQAESEKGRAELERLREQLAQGLCVQ
ncbi:hypothetical protein N0V88_000282 [Collariella sp. IMI 366227]|nr:hypothetical protein N0V88_000282 [Collariella sp. IMI 366227]